MEAELARLWGLRDVHVLSSARQVAVLQVSGLLDVHEEVGEVQAEVRASGDNVQEVRVQARHQGQGVWFDSLKRKAIATGYIRMTATENIQNLKIQSFLFSGTEIRVNAGK